MTANYSELTLTNMYRCTIHVHTTQCCFKAGHMQVAHIYICGMIVGMHRICVGKFKLDDECI